MPNPRTRLIALNADGGANVSILAVGNPRCIEYIEDDGGSGAQGITASDLRDGFVNVYTYTDGHEPVQIPTVDRYPSSGPLLGMGITGVSGSWNYRAADKLVIARSASGTATTLRFTEND